MHVLVIPGAYPGKYSTYAGIFFQQMTEATAEQGIKVGVIAPEIMPFRNTLKFTNWLIFGKTYTTISANGVPIYRKVGMNITPLNRRFNEFIFVKYALTLYKAYIKDHGVPDIIHAHTSLWAGLAALEIKIKHGTSYIITEHSSAFLKNSHSIRDNHINEMVFKHASLRIGVSNALIKAIQSKHRYPFRLIPNSVNTANFSLRTRKGTAPEKLISVGTLLKVKGYDYLLHAFHKCIIIVPNLHLTFVGDGPERENLRKLSQELNIQKNVTFLGARSSIEIAELLKEHDIFVSSSLHETFGVAIIEALASGLPVVATNCGGPLDTINEKNGKICKKADAESLFEAILYVYTNYLLYSPESIRQNAEQKYGKASVINQLLIAYNEVVKSV